jgi:hypothetical protein
LKPATNEAVVLNRGLTIAKSLSEKVSGPNGTAPCRR